MTLKKSFSSFGTFGCSRNTNKKSHKFLDRKGQEEIVGFVVIVLLVALVALIFLGISLRKQTPDSALDNVEINHFLESLMRTSTDCSVSYVPSYLKTSEVLSSCADEPIKRCLDGREVCEVLEEHVSDYVNKSWQIGQDRPLTGWKFYVRNAGNESTQKLFEIEGGECKASAKGGSFLISGRTSALKVYMTLCGVS